MRSTLCTIVMVLGVVVVALPAQAVGGRFIPPMPPPPAGSRENPDEIWWQEAVEVKGKDAKEAKELAVAKAAVLLDARLRQDNPSLEWKPTADYLLEKKLVKVDVEEGLRESLASVEIEVSQRAYKEMLRQDQQQRYQERNAERQKRAKERQWPLFKWFTGLVALLATVAVYTRVQAATKGSYKWWLRLAAVGFVGSVGAVLLNIG